MKKKIDGSILQLRCALTSLFTCAIMINLIQVHSQLVTHSFLEKEPAEMRWEFTLCCLYREKVSFVFSFLSFSTRINFVVSTFAYLSKIFSRSSSISSLLFISRAKCFALVWSVQRNGFLIERSVERMRKEWNYHNINTHTLFVFGGKYKNVLFMLRWYSKICRSKEFLFNDDP